MDNIAKYVWTNSPVKIVTSENEQTIISTTPGRQRYPLQRYCGTSKTITNPLLLSIRAAAMTQRYGL